MGSIKEVLVDQLLLASFPNEMSPYYNYPEDSKPIKSVDRFRHKLKWHISHSLSPRQKEVLRFYLMGKKEREIAHILGVTQQVVHIYKHRAIRKLQKILTT